MRIAQFFAAACLFVMLVCIILQVIFRYLDIGISWTEEVARLAMSYLTFIGAAACFFLGNHIAVDLLLERLSKPVRRVITIVTSLVSLSTMTLVGYYTYILLGKPAIYNQKTPALQIPTTFVYGSLLAGAILSVVFILFRIVRSSSFDNVENVSNKAVN